MNVQVIQKMKSFALETPQILGEIVDYSSVVRDGATIDFTTGQGQGKFYICGVQSTNRKFTITYYDNSQGK